MTAFPLPATLTLLSPLRRTATLTLALGTIAVALALAQDKPAPKNPYYDSRWEEEFVLARRKDSRSKKEAALIKVRFTKSHPLEECLGRALAAQTLACPAARIFALADAATPWTARFAAGDEWHIHLLRADGSQTAVFIEPDGKPIDLEPSDLASVARLAIVSARYDVTLEKDRMMSPPYAFAIAVERDRDPFAEIAAQPEAAVGSTAGDKTIAVEPRAYSENEFALAVTAEGVGADAPVSVGVGRAMLRPRVTLDGVDQRGRRQHVGIYPLPPGLDHREELVVEVGDDPFSVKGFPPSSLRVHAPESVDALSAEVKATIDSRAAGREAAFEVLYAWGSMSKSRASIETASAKPGAARKITGEAETCVFVRAWAPWAKRGGMILAADSNDGASGKWDRVVDPPARPYRVINLRGSGKLNEAAAILGPGLPFLPIGLLNGSSWPQVFEVPGGGGGAFDPGLIQILAPVYVTNVTNRGGGGPGGGGSEDFVCKPDPASSTLDFGLVEVGKPSTKSIKIAIEYRDGNPYTTGPHRLWLPSKIGDAHWLRATPIYIQEGTTTVEIEGTFVPPKPKRYLHTLDIEGYNAKTQRSYSSGRLTLDGTGYVKTGATANLKWAPANPQDFGTVLLGGHLTADRIAEVEWDDGDQAASHPLELELVVEGPGKAAFSLGTATKFKVSEGKTQIIVPIGFKPPAVGQYDAKLRVYWKHPGTGVVTKFNEALELGGLCDSLVPPSPPPPGPKLPPGMPEGIPVGSVFRIQVREEAKICTPAASLVFIPTNDGWSKTDLKPGEHVTAKTGPVLVDCGNVKVLYTANADASIGKPVTALPPTGQIPQDCSVNVGENPNLLLTAPEGAKPTLVASIGNQEARQPTTHVGDVQLPGGAIQSLHIATLSAALMGQHVSIVDQDGKHLGAFSTYYWAPEGAPVIWKGQILKMTFRRVGKGPAADVSIQAENLRLVSIAGDISSVRMAGPQAATGKVGRDSERIEVTFAAIESNPGEGQIILRENGTERQ